MYGSCNTLIWICNNFISKEGEKRKGLEGSWGRFKMVLTEQGKNNQKNKNYEAN